MSRFLFTSHWSEDLGHLVSSLPVASELKRRGHEVAFCNPLRVPHALIEEAGFTNLPLDLTSLPAPEGPMVVHDTPEVWDVDHFVCLAGYQHESLVRAVVDLYIQLFREFDIDVVVDAFDLSACIAARAAGIPLVSILHADLHPSSSGYIWWREKPDDLPTSVPTLNNVLAAHGLEPISKAAELLLGDLNFCVGVPETDPIPEPSDVIHLGHMLHQDSEAELPEWLDDFVGERPLIWVYCGNPRYGSYAQWADSIVILKAVFEGLADHEARVLLTTGFQKWPSTRPPLPENFRQTVFLPGVPLAKRSALMIHHGGHNSCLTGAFTGTPALIVPTFTERESNARRVADLGVAQILMPQEDGWGEKYLCPTELRETVDSMLSDSAWTRRAEEFAQTMQKPGRLEDAADRIEALL